MIVISVKGADVLLTAAARPTAAGWAEYAFIGLYVCTDSIYYAYYIVTILKSFEAGYQYSDRYFKSLSRRRDHLFLSE
jgi:hypothetical protein